MGPENQPKSSVKLVQEALNEIDAQTDLLLKIFPFGNLDFRIGKVRQKAFSVINLQLQEATKKIERCPEPGEKCPFLEQAHALLFKLQEFTPLDEADANSISLTLDAHECSMIQKRISHLLSIPQSPKDLEEDSSILQRIEGLYHLACRLQNEQLRSEVISDMNLMISYHKQENSRLRYDENDAMWDHWNAFYCFAKKANDDAGTFGFNNNDNNEVAGVSSEMGGLYVGDFEDENFLLYDKHLRYPGDVDPQWLSQDNADYEAERSFSKSRSPIVDFGDENFHFDKNYLHNANESAPQWLGLEGHEHETLQWFASLEGATGQVQNITPANSEVIDLAGKSQSPTPCDVGSLHLIQCFCSDIYCVDGPGPKRDDDDEDHLSPQELYNYEKAKQEDADVEIFIQDILLYASDYRTLLQVHESMDMNVLFYSVQIEKLSKGKATDHKPLRGGCQLNHTLITPADYLHRSLKFYYLHLFDRIRNLRDYDVNLAVLQTVRGLVALGQRDRITSMAEITDAEMELSGGAEPNSVCEDDQSMDEREDIVEGR